MRTEEEIQRIIASAQSGDQDSIAELFTMFVDRIYRFLRGRLSDEQTAEDITQTVFLEMIQSLPRYIPQQNAKFSTWLFQIARFRLIDHYRQHRETVSLDEGQLPDHPNLRVDAIINDVPAGLDAALARLPERYQTVLHLRYREELPLNEIARVINVSVVNVRVIHFRALRALRQHLSESTND